VSRRPPRDADPDAGRGAFAEVLGGVRPLAGRGNTLAPPLPKPRPAGRAQSRPAPKPRRFLREDARSGRADDVASRVLARLRGGEPPPDREIDLHGLGARAARTRLERELLLAQRAGQHCVLVIHGRGLHSESGGVLYDAVPDWLTQEPIASSLRAFAAAPRALGGQGATLALLRRQRSAAVSSAARTGRADRDPG
jgi:DNA-nicking Smr family endonuclease